MPHLSLWRPVRCDRDGGGLGCRDRASRRPDCADPHAPGAAARSRARAEQLARSARGGYVLIDCEGAPQAIVIATGSEVGLAAQAGALLQFDRLGACAWFRCRPPTFSMRRTSAYRDRVLPPACHASRRGRSRLPRSPGGATSGTEAAWSASTASAIPARRADLFQHFGFTPENVEREIGELL